jgi:hypothetical protein
MNRSSDFPAAIRFSETAQEFCILIETAKSFERRAFFERCFQLVARLVSEAVELPDIEGELDTMRGQVTLDAYRAVVDGLEFQAAEHDSYKMVFDPWEEAAEPIYGSVSNDLADIWRDLKRGLLALAAGSLPNAICDWRFSFQHHWGPFHATHVLRPLFSFVFEDTS